MYNQYLVTGGTGFLGRSILQKLSHSGAKVRTFVLPDDPYAAMIPPDVQSVTGDLLDDASLDRFFEGAGAGTCVIHFHCLPPRADPATGQCGRDKASS